MMMTTILLSTRICFPETNHGTKQHGTKQHGIKQHGATSSGLPSIVALIG
jgi:hypothetical protein